VGKKTGASGQPKFPYTTAPVVLRKLLKEIPKRPKPPKMTGPTLGSWGLRDDTNSRTAIAVLKKVGLLGAGGEPNDAYTDFMKQGVGPKTLAQRIRETYRVLFENSLNPHTDSDEALKNLFNIHSGGGDDAMRFQIQTFKALCEHADFAGAQAEGASSDGPADRGTGVSSGAGAPTTPGLPPVKIDLHIHLPENKTTRDYEAIIQDIAKYIYGRTDDARA